MDLKAVVRVLISDVDPDNQYFTDAQIEVFLFAARNNYYRAAGLALGSLSVDEAITYKDIRTDDQSINGVTGADAIRKRAAELEQMARREDTEDGEQYFSINYPRPQIRAPELIGYYRDLEWNGYR